EFDLAIRDGLGAYPRLHVVPLMDDRAFPVCSPRLLEGSDALRAPADLGRHVLLHDLLVTREEQGPNWRNWLKYAQVTGVDAEKGPAYNDAAMALQAAVAGQGVALARQSLVVDDLRAGLLVCPFGP